MTTRSALSALAGCALALLIAAPAARAEPAPAPVLVELFTSQGCSSCPPADALLGALARREGVVALSFHVDYWDYLGWEDTFADPRFTERQYAYKEAFDARVVYTPQAVVQGAADAVGTDAEALDGMIAEARSVEGLPVIDIEAGASGLTVRLAPGRSGAGGTLWVATYDREATVAIERGENAGRKATYTNVVTGLRSAGAWDGRGPGLFDLPVPPEGQGVAVWLQAPGTGPVLAADCHDG